MPRRLKLEPHLSLEQIETCYRQSKDVIERTHYQSLWLLAKGCSTATVAEVIGYSVSWMYELVRSYNRYGVSMLGDQRHHNQGAEPLLNDEQLAQLWQVLQSPPPDGSLWNGPLVARWMSELVGASCSTTTGMGVLERVGDALTPSPTPALSSNA